MFIAYLMLTFFFFQYGTAFSKYKSILLLGNLLSMENTFHDTLVFYTKRSRMSFKHQSTESNICVYIFCNTVKHHALINMKILFLVHENKIN